jgi:hypothetical protein
VGHGGGARLSATAVGGGRREGVTVTGWCHCGAVGPGGGGGARDPTAGSLTVVSSLWSLLTPCFSLSYCFSFFFLLVIHLGWLF